MVDINAYKLPLFCCDLYKELNDSCANHNIDPGDFVTVVYYRDGCELHPKHKELQQRVYDKQIEIAQVVDDS